ncbi:hypothetical protein C8F04DRAFT_1079269 [Mycena alexandri]|uniref:DUF6533 domain-containing protein n=1 Tax=Mycena alexandri TaxID=1745969 RepID=A0AAD6T8P7_9AGAR|nr:hypothetical protein C8F04DRAFT_1079269 [Mycena alexandri]
MTETLTNAAIQTQFEIIRYLILIPFTIVVYDYALTVKQEVARFWGPKLTWGTALFYLNRYSALFGTMPVVIEYFMTTTDPKRIALCHALSRYHTYFALLSQILVAVMLIMRTYALYERNKYTLLLTVGVTLAAIIVALSVTLTGSDLNTLDAHLRTFGCPSPTPHATNLRDAAAWGGMLVFDVMIFSLTVYKALKHDVRAGSLFSVLLRDGSLYFIIMIASNAVNIGTYTMAGPILSGCGTTMTNALSSVVISRLMLNLRNPNIRQLRHRQPTRTTMDLDFAPMNTVTPHLGTDIALDSVWMGPQSRDDWDYDYRSHARTVEDR